MHTRPLFISTFCCIDHTLEAALDTLATRTSHVEILCDGLHDLLSDSTPCSEYPLSYSVHAPCSDVNIAAINERMRVSSVSVIGDVSVQNISWSTRAIHPTNRSGTGPSRPCCDRSMILPGSRRSTGSGSVSRTWAGGSAAISGRPLLFPSYPHVGSGSPSTAAMPGSTGTLTNSLPQGDIVTSTFTTMADPTTIMPRAATGRLTILTWSRDSFGRQPLLSRPGNLPRLTGASGIFHHSCTED